MDKIELPIFRVWDSKRKQMIYKCVVEIYSGYTYSGLVVKELDLEKKIGRVIDKPILLQYTGLKDKFGFKVYHRDIIFYADDLEDVQYSKLYVIEWDDQLTGWYLNPVDNNGYPNIAASLMARNGKVVGNTYDNPKMGGII